MSLKQVTASIKAIYVLCISEYVYPGNGVQDRKIYDIHWCYFVKLAILYDNIAKKVFRFNLL